VHETPSIPYYLVIESNAGFVYNAKIHGTHNVMKNGMVAEEAAFEVIASENEDE
jgi:flavin-dependent dehydrogenase